MLRTQGQARPGTRLLLVLAIAFVPLVLLEALLLERQARSSARA